MAERLKHAYIGMGCGAITGMFASIFGGAAGPGWWKYFLTVMAFFIVLEGVIGLLFPKKALSFFGGMLRAMFGDETP